MWLTRLEKVRKILVNWNVAPLLVVGFLCYCVQILINYILVNGSDLDPIFSSAVLGLIGTIALLLKECFSIMRKKEDDE